MSEYKLTPDEEENLAEMKEFLTKMKAVPESEKREISQELQDRMQSETETSALMPEENKARLREILRGEKLD